MILEHPSSSDYVVAATSDRITIGCVVEGDGYVYWQKDGVNISDSFKTISPSGNNLTVVNVTKNDTGDYRCIAVNSAGSVTSSDANITISGKHFCWCYIFGILNYFICSFILLLVHL